MYEVFEVYENDNTPTYIQIKISFDNNKTDLFVFIPIFLYLRFPIVPHFVPHRMIPLEHTQPTNQPHNHTAYTQCHDDGDVGDDDDSGMQIVPSIATYFANINAHHAEKIELVHVLFKTVEPMLIKLECIVLESNSGQLENMCLYYAFWENQLLELLIR